MAQRLLILGTGELARQLVLELARRRGRSPTVLGFVTEDGAPAPAGLGAPVLGALGNLPLLVAAHRPDRIVVALADWRRHLPIDALVGAQISDDVVVESGVDAYERLTGKLALESMTPSNVILSKEFRPAQPGLWLALACGRLCAALALLAVAPLLAVIAVLVKLESAGPALFVQQRVGFGGRRFAMYKFRSMRGERPGGSEWARDHADRITPLGRWLRRFRLDELPQLYNVMRGDMCLVGPRPHPVSNFELFVLVSRNTPWHGAQIPYYSLRASVRPGITGWAQVRYKYANGLGEEIEKMRYDLYYIKHYSPWLDLRIVLETLYLVAFGRDGDDALAAAAATEPKPVPSRTASAPGARAALPSRRRHHWS